MRHLDNLNYEIQVGDLVLCLTGQHAYSVQIVKSCSGRKDSVFDDITPTVVFECGGTVYADNVISLAGLNISQSYIRSDEAGKAGMDLFGHPIKPGDEIMFLHTMERFVQTGTAKKLSPKTCLIEIPKNRFNQTEYRKPYSEIINLTEIQSSKEV